MYIPQEDVPREGVPWEDVPREDVPREDVPREDVPREDVPREDVPREDVPREDVPQEAIRSCSKCLMKTLMLLLNIVSLGCRQYNIKMNVQHVDATLQWVGLVAANLERLILKQHNAEPPLAVLQMQMLLFTRRTAGQLLPGPGQVSMHGCVAISTHA